MTFLSYFLKENLSISSLIFLVVCVMSLYFCGFYLVPIWTFIFFPLFLISSVRFQFFRRWSLNAMLSCLVPTLIYLRILVILFLSLLLKVFEVEILQGVEVFLILINCGLTEEGLVVLPSHYKMLSGKNAILSAFPKQAVVAERSSSVIPRIVESSINTNFLQKFRSNNVFAENLINTSLISAVSNFNYLGKALSGETPLIFKKYFDPFNFRKVEPFLVEQVDKILSESKKMGLSEVLDGHVRQNLSLISKAMPFDLVDGKNGYSSIKCTGHILQLQELANNVPLDLVKVSKGPGSVLITFLDDVSSGDALSKRSSLVNKQVNYSVLVEKVASEVSTLASFISGRGLDIVGFDRPEQGDFVLQLRGGGAFVLEFKAPLSFRFEGESLIEGACSQFPVRGANEKFFVVLDFTQTLGGVTEPANFLERFELLSSNEKRYTLVVVHSKGVSTFEI